MKTDHTQATPLNIISVMFLVAGTCIGGGMLMMPIGSGIGGFIPSMAVLTLCWIFMTISALFLLEASLWMKEEDAHVITMASKLLGPVGKVVSWALYLFVCYASLVAYGAGGGVQIIEGFEKFLGISLSKPAACALFIGFFGSILFLSNWLIGRINTLLFGGIILTFIWLLVNGLGEVKPHLLLHRHWGYSVMSIPIILTSFSFQTIVPSLPPLLKKNVSALRWAIIGGTTITFLAYTAWQLVVLGIIPVEGDHGLIAALNQGEQPATTFLRQHVHWRSFTLVAEGFGFFAIVTSFLGLGMGLFDFLADGLHLKKKGFGLLAIGAIVLVPTFFVASYFERVMILALDTTGGYGDSILNGLIPVLMVWIGRYRMGYPAKGVINGGKTLLILTFAFYLFCLGVETFSHLGLITSIYDKYDVFEIHNLPEVLE